MSDLKFNPNNADEFTSLIKEGEFDYIDFGCSKGGSLLFGQQAFNGKRGLGIDCDQSKVELTREAGFDAVRFNIHNLPDEKLVRFVVLSHFLEHVPHPADVFAFVQKACSIATDFVYIQQPYFDADAYLVRNGLKLYWSDWRGLPEHEKYGHCNRMTSLELWILLRDLRETGMDIDFSIHFRHRIQGSGDARIHNLFSPTNQHDFVADEHPDKDEFVEFQEPVFGEIRALITMPGIDHLELQKIVKSEYVFINIEGTTPVDGFRKRNAKDG